MKQGGVIAFTVEKYDGGRWKLNPSRRYSHSIDYVRIVLAAAGFDVVNANEVALRQEAGADVVGWLIVVRKR